MSRSKATKSARKPSAICPSDASLKAAKAASAV